MDKLGNIAEIIKQNDGILIFPHVNMDADALGSCTALCLALRKMGKKAFVMVNEPIPRNLDFLECDCCIEDDSILEEVGMVIMLDCNSMNRIPNREDAWRRGKTTVCIDHHAVGNTDIRFDYYRTEPYSSATGELIFLLIKKLGVEIDLTIANCLFAAITTDSGNFQHNNTTKRTHDIAGKLYKIEGFDSKVISALIYDRKSKEAMKMESKVLSNLEYFADGKVAVGEVTQNLLNETGCTMNESDGIVQRVMSLDGVEIGVLFKEADENIRASMRAKSYANVAKVAMLFGGGGHVRAAGCTLDGPMSVAREHLIPELVKAVEK